MLNRIAMWPAESVLLVVVGCAQSSTDPWGHERFSNGKGSVIVWNFDGDPYGRCPPGWRLGSTNPGIREAVWKVDRDALAASLPHVFRLHETRNTGHTYNVAMVDGPILKDLLLEVKIRGDAGVEDQGGGPMWRVQDEKNYYLCRVNPLEDNFRVYKVVDSKRTLLATATVPLETGRWHTIVVEMIGDRITCWLDGSALLKATDATLPQGGRIGLWTKADAATSFDDLSVRDLSKPPHREQP